MSSCIHYRFVPVWLSLLLGVLLSGMGSGSGLQAQELFNPGRLHDIRVTIAEPGWYDSLQAFYNAGLKGEEKKVLRSAMVIDGDTLAAPVAIRFKGHYSNYGFPGPKKPFRLHFGKFDEQQDYQGIRKLNLHNLAGDPSFMREYIAYGFMRAIGIPASRTAFTRLFINGAYYGCYLVVEEPEDKLFLKQHFGTDKGNLFDAAETTDLAWVDSLPASYPELQLQSKDREGAWNGLLDWLYLVNKYYRFDFLQKLSDRFATTDYLKVLAADMLLDNWDSYAANGRNFYLYETPEDGRIHWIPWDYNLAFWYKNLPPFPANSKGKYRPLIWRILDHPYLKQQYLATLCRLIDQEAATYPVEQLTLGAFNLIRDAVESDTLKFYSNEAFRLNRTEMVTVNMLRDSKPKDVALPGITSYFAKRRTDMRKTLAAMGCDCDKAAEAQHQGLTALIYPNPVRTVLHLYVEDEVTTLQARVITAGGSTLSQHNLKLEAGKATIDIHQLPGGIYFLSLYGEGKQRLLRFFKP
ncbi:CotH kinase family protein [Taibaiella chishuiensis]|uniref:Putative secreted protein (Por secretion system target) n=1 Tax=Taibaiella chishuiensis TaxID=1434707 RepID=A0A2P8D8C5_9BACT|nr:CotH kinase family protein [Taibaiella chishuiensis]PSK93453.1 putative secreted protein (Por secretion system target) [Taibaiella chishuiensis]